MYFALSPSYIHPDENFQGPEVIAGKCYIALLPTSNTSLIPALAKAAVRLMSCISLD